MILIRNRVATVFSALLAAVFSPFVLGQDRDDGEIRPLLQPQRSAVLVTHVWSGGPAYRAGLRSGDVILKADGARVQGVRDLSQALRNAWGEVELVLTDRRGYGRRNVSVDPNRQGRIGISAERYRLRSSPRDRSAVEVTYVFRGSPARRAGLELGDIVTRVDGRPVHSLSEFSEALHDARSGARLHVINVRNGRRVGVYVYPNDQDKIGIRAHIRRPQGPPTLGRRGV